jgi:hypothetical protein
MDSGPFRATLVDPDFFQPRRATVASRQTVADNVGIGIRLGGRHSIALPQRNAQAAEKVPLAAAAV